MTQKILLVDDSVTIRKVVELTFSDEDFQVIPVGDGAQALERARSERPDIIISDVIMPGLNGYELCQRVKADESLRSVPVLLLKGTFESFDEERGRVCGADGVIMKPFEAQEMIRRVKELIAGAAPRVAAPGPPPPPAPQRPVVIPHPAVPPPAAAAPPPVVAPDEDIFGFAFLDEVTAPGAAVETSPAVALRHPEEPEPATEAEDDLWSEVNLRERPTPVVDASLEEEALFGELAAAASAPRQQAPPPAAGPAAASPDQAELQRLLAAQLEAAVRQTLEPLVAGAARKMIEEIVWEIVPDLAEAMIRAEIERITRAADTG